MLVHTKKWPDKNTKMGKKAFFLSYKSVSCRHAHEPGSSSASCCCIGSVGYIETHVSDPCKCGIPGTLYFYPSAGPPEDRSLDISLLSLPPTPTYINCRHSDPGSHTSSRLFYPRLHYGSCLCLALSSREDFSSFLPDTSDTLIGRVLVLCSN